MLKEKFDHILWFHWRDAVYTKNQKGRVNIWSRCFIFYKLQNKLKGKIEIDDNIDINTSLDINNFLSEASKFLISRHTTT